MYNIKFTNLTILKCTVQWRPELSHCWATIITIHLQDFFVFPDGDSVPVNTNSLSSPPPAPGNHPGTFYPYEKDCSGSSV